MEKKKTVKTRLISRVLAVFFSFIFFASTGLADEVKYIPSADYFNTTLTEINNAKSSINVYMYLISISSDEPDSLAGKLLDALVQAKERGVAVNVILDQNIDFEDPVASDEAYQNKNYKAFLLLKKNNVPVFFDEADTLTHAKAIVIDNETVILGSTNWSRAALTKNHEANALIRSKDAANAVLADMSTIKTQDVPAVITPIVKLEDDFLLNENLLGEMVTQSDSRTLDTYLYLLSQYDGNTASKVIVNYDVLAQSLQIDQMTKEDYRRQINKVLEKLDQKYGLISFTNAARNQDALITLKDIKNPKNPYAPEDGYFTSIPTTWWKFKWNQSLPLSAKVMYLVNLLYTKTSSSWFMSRDQISKNLHISDSFISDGTQALRKLNLLEVKYSPLEEKNYSNRQASTYTPDLLYDPVELQSQIEELQNKFGKDKLDRAKAAAAVVFEDNNIQTLGALIDLENQFGQEIIQEAVQKIALKNPDNPKRSASYLINTIKSMGKTKV